MISMRRVICLGGRSRSRSCSSSSSIERTTSISNETMMMRIDKSRRKRKRSRPWNRRELPRYFYLKEFGPQFPGNEETLAKSVVGNS